MQIYPIFPNGFAANSYLVTADGARAVCIDPASPHVLKEAKRRGLDVQFVLLTHGHFDHVGGCAAFSQTGAKIGCLSAEKRLAEQENAGELFGVSVPAFSVDFTFEDGECLLLAGLSFRVLATPGHTAGSACFLLAEEAPPALFTGDTLFCGSVGRTDLPTGDARRLEESLARLCALPFDCKLYPGHGEISTLFYEKTHNGYLKC